MHTTLIAVPYHAGDDRVPQSRGPLRLLAAAQKLAPYPAEIIDRGAPFRDTVSSEAGVNRALASAVQRTLSAGRRPIVLSGSCTSAMGVVAGFPHRQCGTVWLDAHGDFNTPESSTSGFFPGMSLAVVTGHCYRDYWAQVGDATPLNEADVVLFGVRDLSPAAERVRLERSAIRAIGWQNGQPQGDVMGALDALRSRVSEIYVHVDFDAFAPEVAPGVADQVPGGLTLADAERIVRAAAERFDIRAATLATYVPDNDRDDKTLAVALRLIELLAR